MVRVNKLALMIERSIDVRIAIIRILENMPKVTVKLSSYIVQSLQPLFSKETNELALSATIEALMAHQGTLLSNNFSVEDNVSKSLNAGLIDKRSKIKTSWTISSSEFIWSIENASIVNSSILNCSNNISTSFIAVFNEVASNAVQASQNGTIISGYAVTAATLGRWLDWPDELGTNTHCPR
jgi:hypothetical protein